jgi:hypothetical protein
MSGNLSQKILTTIVYYDILDYPLSSFEVWKYLIRNGNEEENLEYKKETMLADVTKELDGSELRKYIEEHLGFYFLKGRSNLVNNRIEKNKISEKKLKIIRKVVWFLRMMPFVRMVGVTGRVAMKNAGAKSDLDLLVVLKQGKIFTGRTLVTLLVHLLGKRRYGNKITNRICLNYFITDNSLEVSTKDIFSSSEYTFIFPMFGFETFKKFQLANGWIADFKDNYRIDKLPNLKLLKDSFFSKNIRNIGEKIFSFGLIEKTLKNWQVKRIKNDPRTKKAGSMIIAGDSALVFLPEPQGPRIYGRFKSRLDILEKNIK